MLLIPVAASGAGALFQDRCKHAGVLRLASSRVQQGTVLEVDQVGHAAIGNALLAGDGMHGRWLVSKRQCDR
jgi:hypothetical protein